MRILIATSSREVVGGVETYLRAVVPALLARGLEIAFFFENDAAAQSERLDTGLSVPVFFTPSEAANFSPDWVYQHGLHDPRVEAELLRLAPSVLFAHDFHGTCISGTKRHAFPATKMCERSFGPACLVHFFPRRCGGLNPARTLSLYGTQSARNRLLPEYRAIVVASEWMRAEFTRNGVPQERVRHIPLFSGETPTPSVPLPRALTQRLLFLGRLTQLKGAELAIDALPRAARKLGRALRLTVAGEGPERAQLENIVRERSLQVDFVGKVNSDARAKLFQEADLMVVPSAWPEPFGLVGIEAGAHGIPTAGFAVGGINEWLTAGTTGEVSEKLTGEGLANAIHRALQDPAHYQALREGAWKKSREFSLEKHEHALAALFSEK